MPAKNRTRRTKPSSFEPRSQRAKPRLDQELIDDQKFQQKLEHERFTAGIVREANEATACPKWRAFKWDTVIEQKTVELGRYLIGRTGRLDLSEPSPNLRVRDDKYLRRRILALTQQEAQRLGVGKSTLHYLRKNAESERSFRVNRGVREKLGHVTTSNDTIEVETYGQAPR
jgi:CRISPR-associated protein Cas1